MLEYRLSLGSCSTCTDVLHDVYVGVVQGGWTLHLTAFLYCQLYYVTFIKYEYKFKKSLKILAEKCTYLLYNCLEFLYFNHQYAVYKKNIVGVMITFVF